MIHQNFSRKRVKEWFNNILQRISTTNNTCSCASILSYIGTGSFTNGGLNSRLDLQKVSENKVMNRNFKGAISR